MPKRQRADGRVRRPADDALIASKELGELSFDELMSSTIDAEVAAKAEVPAQAKPKTKPRRPVAKDDTVVSRPSVTGKPAAPRKRAAADDSSEEEEDAEAALERHQREMARLRKADPAFFQFLKQSDPALLEFGGVDGDDAEEEDEEADEEGGLAGAVWHCIVPGATTSPYARRHQ